MTRHRNARGARGVVAALLLTVVGAACTREEPRAVTTSTAATVTTTIAAGNPATSTATSAPGPTSTTVPPTTTTTSTTSSSTSTTTSTMVPIATVSPDTAPPTSATPDSQGSILDIRPPSDIAPPPLPDDWMVQTIATSVEGRDIVAWRRPVDQPRRTILVVGGIHGNEPVSPPTVRGLVEAARPDDVEVWLVPEMNPDGVLAGTRWNANGVDLNRNFAWGWRPNDGGPAPASEPETQALTSLIDAIRPGLVVWVHQPYGYVSSVGQTDRRFEQAWAAGSGLATRSGTTQHGGGESWTAFEADLPSVLVEIGTWEATPEIVTAQRAGFEALMAELA